MTGVMMKQNKILGLIFFVATGLLLLPLIAMQFTDEVNWSAFDFLVMGILLFGTGLTLEFVMKKVKSSKIKYLIYGIILLAFFLIWAELAVGIFGTPFAGS
ncbi:MAG: hypothetical protein WBL21_05355 [Salinimicrobium sp.]